jgi:hypothetical protein
MEESMDSILRFYVSGLKNLPEVRAGNLLPFFTRNSRKLLDERIRAKFLMNGLKNWCSLRMEFFNIFVIQLPCYAYVVYRTYDRDFMKDYEIGLMLIYSYMCSVDSISLFEDIQKVLSN